LFNTTHVGAILLFYFALAETYALAPGFARWINPFNRLFFMICITSV
jgi:hypothetical protein